VTAPATPHEDRCRAHTALSRVFPFTAEHECRLRADATHDWHVCACGHVWPATL
jgi:hypothetical protein